MPSLYVGHAQSGAPMIEYTLHDDYLTAFANFKPQVIRAATDEIHIVNGERLTDKDYKKHYLLNGAIGGGMIPNSAHSDKNVLGRDILPLDFDDVPDEVAFLDSIHDKLNSRGFGYVLYKTFSYRADNIRYRLLIPLSKMVTRNRKQEFKAIMEVLAKILGTELDDASTRWGQIFFLPVRTEYNADNLIEVHHGYPLVVDSWIEKILTMPEYQPVKTELLAKPKAAYAPPTYKKPLGFALDRIAAGTANPKDYTQVGKLFTNIGMSVGEIERWYQYFETLQPTPLRKRAADPNSDTITRPEKRKTWANMFRDIIDGLDDHEGRNNTMFNFSSFLLDQRVKAETLLRFVEDANARNRPPMGKEFIDTIDSALKRKEREDHKQSRYNF